MDNRKLDNLDQLIEKDIQAEADQRAEMNQKAAPQVADTDRDGHRAGAAQGDIDLAEVDQEDN